MAEPILQPKGDCIPQFFTDSVKLGFRSEQEGRPIYEEREFVKILIPGDRLNAVVEPVSAAHKDRWPEAYKAFRAGLEMPVEGTPLKEWPQVNSSQVKELAHFNIHTLEHLAGLNDIQLQHMMMGGRTLREQARKTLEVAAAGTAPLARLVTENMNLKDEVVRLTRERDEALALAAQHRAAAPAPA